jgi:hypothetical protein
MNVKKGASFASSSRDIDATHYYIKHHVAILDMQRDMRANVNMSFNDKCDMRNMIDIATRKKEYFYKHPNFNIARALTILNALR